VHFRSFFLDVPSGVDALTSTAASASSRATGISPFNCFLLKIFQFVFIKDKTMADKKSNSCVVSKSFGFIFFIFFASSLIAVGLLVYFFADRPTASAKTADDTIIVKSDKLKKPLNYNRLPKALIPYHYDIRLLPILEKGNFSILGQVSIELECRTETDRIVLHSLEIVIDPKSVRLSGRNVANFNVKSVEYDTELEFAIIRLNQTLSKGFNYTLSMEFVGQLNDKLKGFYRSSYQENGVEKYVYIKSDETMRCCICDM